MKISNSFIINRTFNAPRELVWQVWTQAEHLAQWFGPTGFTTRVIKMDLQPGGMFHYHMINKDGFEMWAKWIFRDIVAPEKISLLQSFSDPSGGLGNHPGDTSWPNYTLSTMTFTEINQQTHFHLEWQPYEATDEEIEAFNNAFDDMHKGWGLTLDQLDNYLAALTH